MTTPAQYEAAIRFLESIRMHIANSREQFPRITFSKGYDGESLESALAIVREAREVRETVAARLDYWLAQYPADVFPDVPITHGSEGAMIMRLMLPRIKADLLESLAPEVPDAR